MLSLQQYPLIASGSLLRGLDHRLSHLALLCDPHVVASSVTPTTRANRLQSGSCSRVMSTRADRHAYPISMKDHPLIWLILPTAPGVETTISSEALFMALDRPAWTCVSA